jgi:predicted SAM-dependent methyltransferase
VSHGGNPSALAPCLRRPRAYRLLRAGFHAAQRATVEARRAYYVDGEHEAVVRALPGQVRAALGFDDESARGTRKIEIGGGPHAQRGYVHIDIDPNAHHLEWRAPAWSLPLPDDWATEIVSVHALEHVEPHRLVETLKEWHRVLRPGAAARIHVPNGPALFESFVRLPVERKWPVMGSILGMYCSPSVRDPRGLSLRSDHQLIFDEPLLRWALESAGFRGIEDLTQTVRDRHDEAWDELVLHYSLIVDARKPAPPSTAG